MDDITRAIVRMGVNTPEHIGDQCPAMSPDPTNWCDDCKLRHLAQALEAERQRRWCGCGDEGAYCATCAMLEFA